MAGKHQPITVCSAMLRGDMRADVQGGTQLQRAAGVCVGVHGGLWHRRSGCAHIQTGLGLHTRASGSCSHVAGMAPELLCAGRSVIMC